MTGKTHVFQRDHINTDEIIPARYLTTDSEEELALHVMEDIDSGFASRMKAGDIIGMIDGLMARLAKEILGLEISLPLARMTYDEAMERFGHDAPAPTMRRWSGLATTHPICGSAWNWSM